MKQEWDVTTPDGRWELEKYLMPRIGFLWVGGTAFPDNRGRWCGFLVRIKVQSSTDVLPGWIYSLAGMDYLKRFTAHEFGAPIHVIVERDRCRAAVRGICDEFEEAPTEPEAVALAVGKAFRYRDALTWRVM